MHCSFNNNTISTHSMHYKLILAVTSIIMSVTFQTKAHADASIELIADQQNAIITVKDQRIQIQPHNNANSAIYDTVQQTLYLIDNEQRIIRPITKQTIDQIAGASSAVSQQLNKLPAGQRDQLASFLGLSLDKPSDEVRLQHQSNKQILGIACDEQQIIQNNKVIGAICVSTSNSTQLNDSDYNTLLAAQSHLIELSQHAKKFANYFKQPIPALDSLKLNGLLIDGQQFGQQPSSFKLIKLNTDEVSMINLPTGYRTENMASLLGQ